MARTQLVGLLAMENKVMKQMCLARERLLNNVTDDLVEVVVEKLTRVVKQMVESRQLRSGPSCDRENISEGHRLGGGHGERSFLHD